MAGHLETLAASTVAVISRSEAEVFRLAMSDRELYATYYQLLDAGVRLPVGDRWDVIRAATDSALFPGFKESIRFGALSVDGRGVPYYGEFSLVLRDEMVAHRSTVFEENSVLFMQRMGIRVAESDQIPPGYRATWHERARLCLAKLAERIRFQTQPAELGAMILEIGARNENSDFLEVHVCGPISIRAVSRVVSPRRLGSAASRTRHTALARKLRAVGVALELGP